LISRFKLSREATTTGVVEPVEPAYNGNGHHQEELLAIG